MDNFIFVDLASGVPSFDGMAAGSFTDMHGKKVTFAPGELSAYIDNTREVLESTRTEGGEIVGLPIDLDGHDHKGGAGWITGVELDPSRPIIKFLANWTQAGSDLIKSNTRRFFSPTVDPSEKVILGGSMTNWPASRDNKHRMMLRPIELSEQIQEIDMAEGITLEGLRELANEFLAHFKPAQKQEQESSMSESVDVAELMKSPEAIAELERLANERAAELLKAEQLKSKVAEFSAKLTGGAVALSMKADEISAALLSFAEPENVMDFIGKVMEAKLVNFQESGTNGKTEGKTEFPKELRPFMQTWLAAGKTPESFFDANPEIGLAADYDLAEFAKEK